MDSKFSNDLNTGKIGEKKVYKYLSHNKKIKHIEDVTENKEYQNMDVDFICYNEDDKKCFIEVKTDTIAHKSGNIAYEIISNKHYGTIGCFEKTKAHIIFYYLLKTDELYIIKTKKLREYVNRKYKNRGKEIYMGDYALGYLIPIKDLLELNKNIKDNKDYEIMMKIK